VLTTSYKYHQLILAKDEEKKEDEFELAFCDKETAEDAKAAVEELIRLNSSATPVTTVPTTEPKPTQVPQNRSTPPARVSTPKGADGDLMDTGASVPVPR
jgi:hypothetical protein